MKPIVLTTAFLRPRATRLSSGVSLSEDTNVFACVEEMVSVIREEINASPILLPASFDPESTIELLRHVDGIMLPGAASNIHPSHYGQNADGSPQTFDVKHDEMDMFLIQQARKMGIPFFGICRAMQAVNVAFGGTLQQQLKKHGGIDHSCSNPCDGHNDAPDFMHEVLADRGGVFSSYFPTRRIPVNSMHEQAVDRLGSGLKVEARATDGVIEAISCLEAQNFFVAVQWHPEALPKHPVSQKLFEAFRAEVETHFEARRDNNPRPGVFRIAQWQNPRLG